LKTDSIYANSSAGMYLLTNSGAAVAHWGGGGSVEVDFKGFAGYDANRSSSYTARSFTDKNYVDSADALRVRYSDTAAMLAPFIQYSDTTGLLSQVVRTFGTQTVGGNKTFSNDIVVNGATIGRRTQYNLAFGNSALLSNTTGVNNTAIGDSSLRVNTSGETNNAIGDKALEFNTTGSGNTAIGGFALNANTTGASNTGIGLQAGQATTTGSYNISFGEQSLLYNTTGSRNIAMGYRSGWLPSSDASGLLNNTPEKSIYIGSYIRPLLNNQTNQIVIGDSAIGNGSNTVTIGNSSVTDNYFTGNIRGGAFIKSGGTSSQFLKADGSIDGTAYGTGSVTSISAGIGMSFTTITSTGAVNADTTTLATRAYAAGLDVAKANTSLNNVNGVLSSTYGGAGSVSGILKANGSGVVSAAVAGTDYVAPSALSSYVPYSGATTSVNLGTNSITSIQSNISADGAGVVLQGYVDNTLRIAARGSGYNDGARGGLIASTGDFSGALSGTSLSMSGGISATSAQINTIAIQGGNNLTWGGTYAANIPTIVGVSGAGSYLAFYPSGSSNGEAARFSNSNRLLIATTTDNGTDALQVAGSVYASNSGNTYKSFLGAYYKERNNNGSNAGGYEWEEALGYGVSSTIKGSLQFGNKYTNSFETAARIVLTNAANSQYAALSFDGNTGAATFSSSVTASSLIKSGGTSTQALIADGSVQTLTSGTYTPTITNTTNVSSSTARVSYYTRVGDIVTVHGWVALTTTSNENTTVVGISLPIASNFSAFEQLSGSGNNYVSASGGQVGKIEADATNDRATLTFYPYFGAGGSIETQFTFSYRVI
jgi:hypothetical protein